MKDYPFLFFFFKFTFLTMTLKNLNFAVGTPKLRNWGGVQVSWMHCSVWSSLSFLLPVAA